MNYIKQYKSFFILPFLLFMLILFVCKQNKMPIDTNTNDELIPLEIGNYWVYEASSFFPNDTLVNFWKFGITGSTDILFQGEKIQVFYWVNIDYQTGIPAEIKYYYKNESDGLFIYGATCPTDTLVFKSLYLKYPVKIAEQWNHQTITILSSPNPLNECFAAGETLSIECIKTSHEFLTPVGRFNCYEFHYQIPQTSNKEKFLYFSPNIGFVGMIEKENNQIVHKWVLKEYQIL